ncbi:MAG: polysaccharide biosynthesis protein [Armatimonadota bacterium]
MKPLDRKRVLITGGTGSLGKTLVRRLLTGEMGEPESIVIFSRDEAKQHFMRVELQHQANATDDLLYGNFVRKLKFVIGDVRHLESIAPAVREADYVVNAAALKQVPACEYFPYQAVMTNITGAENIVRAIQLYKVPVDTVVGVSTDKACKPVNVMGMTKAVQERIFIDANLRCPATRFVCVRYGNVLASRGSVVPLFQEQIRHGGPITITTPTMTRFLISLNEAVDTIFAAILTAKPGETYIPRAPSATVKNIALAMIGTRDMGIDVIGIRPGEKVHEILISEEEIIRTASRGEWYAIRPSLPELREIDLLEEMQHTDCGLVGEFSSEHHVLSLKQTVELLERHNLLIAEESNRELAEVLR